MYHLFIGAMIILFICWCLGQIADNGFGGMGTIIGAVLFLAAASFVGHLALSIF